jgi:hypothetical protein
LTGTPSFRKTAAILRLEEKGERVGNFKSFGTGDVMTGCHRIHITSRQDFTIFRAFTFAP